MLRLLTLFLSFLLLTYARPQVVARADTPAGVDQLNHVATQLTNLIEEVKTYKGWNGAAGQIFAHANEVLKTLDEATNAIQDGPEIGIFAATAYVNVAITLSTQVKSLSDAIKQKKKVIVSSGYAGTSYQFLDVAYDETGHLFDIFAKKITSAVTPILKYWQKQLVAQLADARAAFLDYAPNQLATGVPQLDPNSAFEYQQQGRPQQAQPQFAPYPPPPQASSQYPPLPQQAPPPGYAWALTPISAVQSIS